MLMNAAESILDLISPLDLGLPPKFSEFRPPQRQALEWLQNECTHQISAACLPTGAGKTAIAVALAKLLGVKAVYLVATKALQQQVLNDFESMGMVDIRGRANYECPKYGNCERGIEEECRLYTTNQCAYSRAVERAKDAELVVTNYAYWLNARKFNSRALEREGRPVELLICDECHALESQLGSFAEIKIYTSEIGKRKPEVDSSGIMGEGALTTAWDWAEWAKYKIEELTPSIDDDDEDLLDRCLRILQMNSNWVWQFDSQGHVTFEPVRVNAWSLFSGVSRVLLMSASLNEFTLRLLLPTFNKESGYDYRAWGQVFPPQNAPVYHIPCRKLTWRSSDEDYRAVIEAADAIIDQRLDRKAIIHTVSYNRAERAIRHSRHSGRFIWNDGAIQLERALERFREAEAGAVLVTPSVGAGFDFPGEACEYQIILKFPFPNETERVVKERCTQIPGYRLWSAAQSIVQMCGRARRYHEDRVENFILDNSVRQLCGPEGKSYCPPGFRIFTVKAAPPPPPRINSSSSSTSLT
jgi:Rad3-related DNA helicase